MDLEELQRRLMATFQGELEEHLRSLSRELLALEKESAPAARVALLKSLFRTVHSLKGAARSVSVKPIEERCHRLEELLAGARDGKLTLDAAQFRRLLAAADAVAEAGQTLLGAAPPAAAPAPEAAPPTPAAPPSPVAPPSPPVPPPAAEAATAAHEAAAPAAEASPAPEGSATARVPGERLDALLQGSDEVLVALTRLGGRREALLAAREAAAACRRERRASQPSQAPRAARATGRGDHRGAGRGPSSLDERLARLEKDLADLDDAVGEDLRRLGLATGALHENIRGLRMVPLDELCPALERAVRDLGDTTGKEVRLVVTGGAVAVDRQVLQRLKDPLLHLVRNAIDHGIERPPERAAAGKPARGTVQLAAELRGSEVLVSVADDGQGLDVPAIAAQARRRGMTVPASEREAGPAIFSPGFSTAAVVTELSGRGVGLDVVKSEIEALHGAVSFASEKGRGVRFTLRLPVTLSSLHAVLFAVADQIYALPASAVRRLVRVTPDQVVAVEGRDMLKTAEGPIPLGSLAQALGKPPREQAAAGVPRAAIVEVGTRTVALLVDQTLEEREILLKPLGPHLRQVRFVLGATVMPDGQLALVLNTAELVRAVLASRTAAPLAAAMGPQAARPQRRVLVADDSLTTRSLEKSILESAGYEVIAVADGQEAWRVLQERPVDLVVSDVEMPRMDGFTLAETIRGSRQWGRLPVVLVSALASDADRARGLAVGANAYIVKASFEQRELLETVAQLL
jgi:two-component system chemotaxis sensor kinase CheA